MENIKYFIDSLIDNSESYSNEVIQEYLLQFIELLNSGTIRAAERNQDCSWSVNIWVKKGILQLFKYGRIIDYSSDDFNYYDKHTLPVRSFNINDGIRIVPGGSSVRAGSYLAKGVICMPPMYVNIGAYVDEDTMLDSHSLIGTCAQIGKRVHISAASQIGGVLEPAGSRPVIIEDDVLVGGNCGLYEGVLVRQRAVIAAGVILTSSTKVYDLVNETVIQSTAGQPLEIPANAVLIPGTRSVDTEFGKQHGLSISSPIIIKYRDDRTDAKTALEDALR